MTPSVSFKCNTTIKANTIKGKGKNLHLVTPAEAGVQKSHEWIPTFESVREYVTLNEVKGL
jgi:hypothetical protein